MNNLFPLPRTASGRAVSNTARAEPETVYPTFQGVALEIGVVLATTLAMAFAVVALLQASGVD